MRKLYAVAMFTALSVPCMAADTAQPAVETVIVTESALVGVWKISFPSYVEKAGFFGDLKWGPLSDHFCRIEQSRSNLKTHCLWWIPDGTVVVHGAKIHFAWGWMIARFVIDGTLQSSTSFAGRPNVKLSGIELDGPEQSTGTKLTLPGALPDKPGKAVLLSKSLEELAAGSLIEPHDDAAITGNSGGNPLPVPAALRALGAVQAVLYLGEFAKPLPPGTKPDIGLQNFSVYDVEFANGERLCGLHQRNDGALDAFVCV